MRKRTQRAIANYAVWTLAALIILALTACASAGLEAASAPASPLPSAPSAPSEAQAQAQAPPSSPSPPTEAQAPPTSTPTPIPTLTPYPAPTLHPTPLPTIVIPMLTGTAPPIPTPRTRPDLWTLPDRVVPESFGVEIHFTHASRQELDYLAAGGFRWVRMDLFWHTIEKELGKYDFSEYDLLVNAMTQRGIRVIFILDYGNSLYDHGFPPTSPGGQAAYARFAAAAAYRYRHAGIIWDLWNEPNLDHFWPPEANATHYGQLALGAIAAIRRVDPTAIIVGPALCGFEWDFWHTLGRMGLYRRLDAVTVHPYGVLAPEELLGPYLELRALIDSYTPGWKVPIWSGEWGFATTEGGLSELGQAQYLSRQWLFNLSHDIDLSIWYDWRNDGTDPHDPEHNFGTVRHDYGPKPSYQAARTLATTLAGYRFLRRIPLASENDYLLLFQEGDRVALAAWTTADPHTLVLPLPVDEASGVGMTGELGNLKGEGERLAVPVSGSPRYLLFRSDQAPAYLGGWRPLDTVNPLSRSSAPAVQVLFEDFSGMPRFGELQIWVKGVQRGAVEVHLSPMARRQVRLPVDLSGLEGNVRAELRLVIADDVMAPLQTAAIWLQVTP
jgi:polysaccharide biosynthesis protein PslG